MHELVLVVSTAVTSQLPKRLILVKITLTSTKYTKKKSKFVFHCY